MRDPAPFLALRGGRVRFLADLPRREGSMIRQAQSNTLFTRDSIPAALLIRGMSCAEHKRPMTPFGRFMGLTVPAGPATYAAKRRISTEARLFRKARVISPIEGSEVLSLGQFARASRAEQIRAIIDSPASYEIAVGTLGGLWKNLTPISLEEPYLDLLRHSEQNLAIAYDDQSVLVGGDSAVSIGIVRWLADLFATKTVRFLSGERFIAFCDPHAARDLMYEGRFAQDPPSGYARLDFASSWRPLSAAA